MITSMKSRHESVPFKHSVVRLYSSFMLNIVGITPFVGKLHRYSVMYTASTVLPTFAPFPDNTEKIKYKCNSNQKYYNLCFLFLTSWLNKNCVCNMEHIPENKQHFTFIYIGTENSFEYVNYISGLLTYFSKVIQTSQKGGLA